MSWLPRIAILPNTTPGLNDAPGYPDDFEGWAFVIQWRCFVVEYVVGRRRA